MDLSICEGGDYACLEQICMGQLLEIAWQNKNWALSGHAVLWNTPVQHCRNMDFIISKWERQKK